MNGREKKTRLFHVKEAGRARNAVLTNKIACFYERTIEFDGKMNVYFNKQRCKALRTREREREEKKKEKLPTNENLLFYVIILADYYRDESELLRLRHSDILRKYA